MPRRRSPIEERKRLVDIAEAADHLDVSTRTIRRYIADGRLRGYRVGARLIKVDVGDLDALIRPIPSARTR